MYISLTMETVFDHNITREELEAVLGFSDVTKERLDSLGFTQRDHYSIIYRLYTYRGDHVTAKEYADKIPNDVHKVFGTCYHDFAHKR